MNSPLNMQYQFMMMNNAGMMNSMMINNGGMMNQMMMNNAEMMNPMMMNNVGMMNNGGMMNNAGMMNPMMMNNNAGMMNQFMMNNAGMMNQFMMNNDGMMNPFMMNNYDGMENKTIYLLIGEFGEDNYEPIIINKDDDINTLREKLLSCLKSIGKPLCRDPYPGEVIERISPNETLEYLIERGVFEKYPNIMKKIKGRSSYVNKVDEIKNGDKLFLDIPLRGAGGPLIEFADVDKMSKAKNLKFSKNAKNSIKC